MDSSSSSGVVAVRGTSQSKYLMFLLEKEEYGIEILRVQEIIGMLPITMLPRNPNWIRGVMNLRGQIIPVLDLRVRLAIPGRQFAEEKCIIVVRCSGGAMGLIVDRVSEVVNIPPEQVDRELSLRNEGLGEFIAGIGRSEGRIRFLLNLDAVLGLQKSTSEG